MGNNNKNVPIVNCILKNVKISISIENLKLLKEENEKFRVQHENSEL